jgi:hypothetical protein
MALPDPQVISSRHDFEQVLFELLDDNDALKWENDSAYSFLQAMAEWLRDAEGFYRNAGLTVDANSATWQLFADMLRAAAR